METGQIFAERLEKSPHDIQSKKASRKAWLKEIETNALTGEASELFAEGCREFHGNLEMKNPFEKPSKLKEF